MFPHSLSPPVVVPKDLILFLILQDLALCVKFQFKKLEIEDNFQPSLKL